jgi:ribosomal protein S18 acetylase RimI-like enzyme
MNLWRGVVAIKIVIGAAVLSCEIDDISGDYSRLLWRLYKKRARHCDEEGLMQLLDQEDELLVFAIENRHLVGMAQASLSRVDPDWNAVIGNVIVLSSHEGVGCGRKLLNALEESISYFWRPRLKYLVLTNNPNKGNGAFYKKLGYHPRIDDRWPVIWLKSLLDWLGYKTGNETIVWVKNL